MCQLVVVTICVGKSTPLEADERATICRLTVTLSPWRILKRTEWGLETIVCRQRHKVGEFRPMTGGLDNYMMTMNLIFLIVYWRVWL